MPTPPFPSSAQVHLDWIGADQLDGHCRYRAYRGEPYCTAPAEFTIFWSNSMHSPVCAVHTAWARTAEPIGATITRIATYTPQSEADSA